MLKKEAGIAERKLLARNERIQNLEALLQDADRRLSVQNQKFESQLQAVKDRLDQARGKSIQTHTDLLIHYWCAAQKASVTSTLSFGRIAKPLRGGGGTSAMGTTNAAPTPITGGGISTSNPLARLQNDDAGYVTISDDRPVVDIHHSITNVVVPFW